MLDLGLFNARCAALSIGWRVPVIRDLQDLSARTPGDLMTVAWYYCFEIARFGVAGFDSSDMRPYHDK